MTTDITELAQREKFEAWWEREYKHLESSKYTDAVPHIKYGFWMAYQAGGAELVEAVEKAQAQSSKWLEAYHKAVKIGARYEERIAELESRTVKLPEPHAHLIWIQAGHAPDDYWDDVAVSHSEKDRCCDGSERYPVYARWEIEEMLTATGIKWEAE
ncbi:hypothetical protein [Klebsiella michiganensis]|uniref:hypothetical protein n=1 Tax=Klebsiella michiganensis TaxID=1134687 RepID=UPI0012B88BE2|nr:hypothetical protein [Klebsiella michiganensis]